MVDASKPSAQAVAGEDILAVTAREWNDYAPASVRDAFLASLDNDDEARTIAMARHLLHCGNPLPSSTCAALGVAPGSCYGAGAQAFLTRAGATW